MQFVYDTAYEAIAGLWHYFVGVYIVGGHQLACASFDGIRDEINAFAAF